MSYNYITPTVGALQPVSLSPSNSLLPLSLSAAQVGESLGPKARRSQEAVSAPVGGIQIIYKQNVGGMAVLGGWSKM